MRRIAANIAKLPELIIRQCEHCISDVPGRGTCRDGPQLKLMAKARENRDELMASYFCRALASDRA